VKRFSLLLHYSDVSENGSSKVAAKKPETEFSFRLDSTRLTMCASRSRFPEAKQKRVQTVTGSAFVQLL
jgi:hypothetical protein